MSSITIENEKISQIENGLVPAICVEGMPLIKKNLFEQMKELKVPSVSIAVINDGTIEWAKAYGVYSTQSDQKVDITTRFQAGSLSKPVAAFGVLSLVKNGVLDLDEDVNTKLTSWKIPENEYTKGKKITLRHLLSHSSGLGVVGFDGYMKNEPMPTITETLDGLEPANNPPVRAEFIPCSKMSYSGGGYNVVQQLVEDVTKISFTEFMNKAVLKPLAMDESTFAILDPTIDVNTAHAHPTGENPIEDGWKNYPESAAAGLWTTPVDFAKWLIEVQDEMLSVSDSGILNKELLKEMVTPQVVVYGLGTVVNGEKENLELVHKGRTDGFTCGYVSFPYRKQGAVVMINSGNEAAFVDDILRSIASSYNWPSHSVKVKKTIEIDSDTLDKYVGRYGWNEKPNDIYDLFIFKENNELFCRMGNATNVNKLYLEGEDQFFLIDTGYGVAFKKEDESTTLIITVQPGFEREFKKF